MSYDVGDIEDLRLSCHAEGGTKMYDIEWYKLSSTGPPKKLKLNTISINDTSYKIAQPGKMYEQNVAYMCELIRQPVNHRSFTLVNITLSKGNGI